MEYNGDGTCNVCEEGYTRGRWSMAGLCRKCTCASVDGNGVEQCNCATCSAQGYCSSCKDGYIFNSNLQPHLERCTPGNAIITIIIHFQRFKCHSSYNGFIQTVLLQEFQKEDGHFCPFCNTTYNTLQDAIVGCKPDPDCNIIYDVFCDGVGYFCTCPIESLIKQSHPNGIDCIYKRI